MITYVKCLASSRFSMREAPIIVMEARPSRVPKGRFSPREGQKRILLKPRIGLIPGKGQRNDSTAHHPLQPSPPPPSQAHPLLAFNLHVPCYSFRLPPLIWESRSVSTFCCQGSTAAIKFMSASHHLADARLISVVLDSSSAD